MFRLLSEPGFLSAQTYLLGSFETRCQNDNPPAPGPTLIDFFMPDGDRHTSGLHCYEQDHLRAPVENILNSLDPDIPMLQKHLDPADHLTDSESDEDGEAYASADGKPSLRRVRKILRAVPEAVTSPVVEDDKKKKGKGAEVTTPSSPAVQDTNLDDEEDESLTKGHTQVDLLRDRKILDMEAYLLQCRHEDLNSVADRLLLVYCL